MRNSILACMALMVVSGCVAPLPPPLTYEQQRANAKTNSVDELCLISVVHPEFQKAALDELVERKAECNWERVKLLMQYREMQANQAAQQAQINAQRYQALIGASMLMQQQQQQRPAPQPLPQFPVRTNCNTYGNQTNCITQ